MDHVSELQWYFLFPVSYSHFGWYENCGPEGSQLSALLKTLHIHVILVCAQGFWRL